MQIDKTSVKEWLKRTGHSRAWLAQQCGGISKRTVDNWLSSPAEIPPQMAALILRLMAEEATQEKERSNAQQNLILEVELDTFERWSRAALKHGEILTDYAIRAIEEAAQRDLNQVKSPQQLHHFPHPENVHELPKVAEEPSIRFGAKK